MPFLISPYEMKSIQIQNSCIQASSSEELLGIKTDSNLTFHDYIISSCSKPNKKGSAQSRVSKYMGINKTCINKILYFLTIYLLSPRIYESSAGRRTMVIFVVFCKISGLERNAYWFHVKLIFVIFSQSFKLEVRA